MQIDADANLVDADYNDVVGDAHVRYHHQHHHHQLLCHCKSSEPVVSVRYSPPPAMTMMTMIAGVLRKS